MEFVNIGLGNVVNKDRIISIVNFDSSPVKRVIQLSRDKGMLVDASGGKSTRSVVVTDSGHVILSSLSIECIINN